MATSVIHSFVKFKSMFRHWQAQLKHLAKLPHPAPAGLAAVMGIALIGTVLSGSAQANEYSASWGPAVGEPLPALAAQDQTGAVRTLADLAGPQGLLVFYYRSADW